MKNNKLLIVLILLLQGICCAGYAQPGTDVTPCNGGDCNLFNNQSIKRTDTSPSSESNTISYRPIDPNEIVGLDGYNAPESTDTLRWVSATQSLAYTIYFENDAELAMAAASKVAITVPLHEKLNYATFGVGSFGFGSHIIAVEGSPSSYQTRIDLRDSMGIYLDVVAGLDIVHNEAFWIFQSIDPATGLPPININSGFLPINDSLHSGEGFVSFTIKPKTDQCVTGDTVSATASIVFDVNEAIPTNTWVNTIDAVAPTSTLTITPNATGDMLTATFAGEDDAGGCGVKQYKLYYSVNGSAYQLYDVYPVGDTAEIPVETGMEYEFFTLAEDNVGNCEPMKTQPEYTIGTNFVTLAVNAFPQEAGTVTGAGTYSVNDTAVLSATASEGYHFVNWMCQGVPVSTQNPYSAVVSQNQTYTAYFERNAYTLQTLAAVGSSITVVDLNGNEVPSGSTVLHFDRLIVSTDTLKCYTMSGLLLNGEAFVPGDTLTVTGDIVLSTQAEPIITKTDTMATACDSFVWYGETLTETANYSKTFTNAEGCDSVVTLHLTVLPADYVEYAETVCDSYTWNDSVYTYSGDYVQTFTNVAGCDSVVTLHLTVNNSNTGDTTAIACDNYDWYGTSYTTSGDYTHTLTNAAGCDSVVTLHLTVNYSNTGDTTAIACDSFEWYGTTYTTSGDYTHTLTNAAGCDSVVTLHLTVNYSNMGDTTAVACDSFEWYGTTYASSGDYSHTLTNAAGCDSVVTLHLTVNYSNTGDTTAIACDSYAWYGTTYTTSGDYTHTLTNAAGCDSVVTLHLTVNYSNTGDTTAIACDSYAWYGTTYTTSGDYSHTFTNVSGCDSVVTLHLTVNYSNTGDTTAVACDSYDWYGTTYTSTGDYSHTLTNAAGCDSVVTLHLTVNYSNTGDTTAVACDSYAWHGTTYTSSGEYTHTFTNVSGCDSVVTLHLTVNYSNTGDTTAIACDSFEWYGTTYALSGDYSHTLTNAAGCDSVVTLHLTVNNSNTGDTTAIACDSYAWYGTTYTSSGDYTHTLTNAAGCDSVVTLHLTVNYSNTGDTTAIACDSYAWYGTTYTSTGDYSHTLTNTSGCDSVVTLHLTVNNSNTGDTTTIACDSYDWYGTTYTTSGDYTHTLTNANGCDSVVTLHLTVNYSNTGDTTAVSCDSYNWYGTTYTTSGEYTHTVTNAAGCDSVVTLHLTVNHPVTELVEATACDSYTWNDITYTQSGDYTQTLTAANGCDSVVTLHLTITELPELQAISGETELCINEFATYQYDVSDPTYQYRWFKDNTLWAENVPEVMLHETGEGSVLLTMQVADGQSGCAADTSLLVQVVNRFAPDTTEIRRKANSNILFCQPITSEYGTVHYRWGYTNRFTFDEVVMPGDHNYCLYDFGIDTLSYRYWVETYLNSPIGEGCDNRSYYGQSYGTATFDFEDNTVEAYLVDSRIVLYASLLSPDNVSATLYDVNGKQLLMRMYGFTETVSDVIPVNIAPGVYLLKVIVGNQMYSFKLLKI
jgi:hypothetical protein